MPETENGGAGDKISAGGAGGEDVLIAESGAKHLDKRCGDARNDGEHDALLEGVGHAV